MLEILIFLVILGLLIFVHELGHFLVARRNGITASEFGFGFPPRLLGIVKSEKTGKYRFVFGKKEVRSANTVYSINWIPLGGFVKIKGEDGDFNSEKDSFAAKGAWTKTKVLAAGVTMNFILAWFLLSLTFMIGAPEAVGENEAVPANSKIQISEVLPDTPASDMGLKVGDEIIKTTGLQSIDDVQNYIAGKKGQEMALKIRRGKQILELKGSPRQDVPAGQGPLGIVLIQTVIRNYPWYESIWLGFLEVFNIMLAMVMALFSILRGLVAGEGVKVEIAGPVGIAVMTKQFSTLGLVYLMRFAALLSVNLGIINAFPFPALDGGRILFVLIGKFKGRPIAQNTEHVINTIGFMLLILLMIMVTFRDVAKLIR